MFLELLLYKIAESYISCALGIAENFIKRFNFQNLDSNFFEGEDVIGYHAESMTLPKNTLTLLFFKHGSTGPHLHLGAIGYFSNQIAQIKKAIILDL